MRKGIVICDIDGVLNDVGDIAHLHKKGQFDEMTELSNDATLRKDIVELIRFLAGNYALVFLTGRHYRHRESTKNFLDKIVKVGGQYHLAMRTKDVDSSVKLKVEWINSNIDIEDIFLAFEDRKDIATAYGKLGIPTVLVGTDNFSDKEK